jgi:molybdate transport system substrate-binding protein
MYTGRKISVVSIIILSICVWLLKLETGDAPSHQEGTSLVLFCAAGIKGPVAAVAQEYEELYGVHIQIQYGGSGTLLSNLTISQIGDLYLAADQSYIDIAKQKGLVDEHIALARQRPVIGVRKGNPKNIQSVHDLLQKDVTLALANPEAASIGKQTKIQLENLHLWTAIEQQAVVFKPTVMEIANDIKLGTVDAGIIWDATANQYPEIDIVNESEFSIVDKALSIGVLTSCNKPAAALHFARYLGARDRGLLTFKKWGYDPVAGDEWADKPDILLFSGGVNRPAVQITIQEFMDREGVSVSTVYNGCGILVAQMKAGERPDAYFACDVSFMTQVADVFTDEENISQTAMVIVTPKGNPDKVATLEDLIKPGLQLGMANPKQSALGALTERLLDEMGIRDSFMKNVRSQTPTADLLINQIRTGSLDAVVVYEANTSQVRDVLEVIPIKHPAALAIQPIAAAKNTRYPQLTSRLLQAIRSAKSRERFTSTGFDWLAESE